MPTFHFWLSWYLLWQRRVWNFGVCRFKAGLAGTPRPWWEEAPVRSGTHFRVQLPRRKSRLYFQDQDPRAWHLKVNYQLQDCSSNKNNDRLYQGTTYNHIHWPIDCGKTHLVLDLIEKEYNKHFDYIIITCPTLRWNKTYHTKPWIKIDDKVWLVEPKGRLYQWIEKLLQLLACSDTLFFIDGIITDKGLNKRRLSLLELAISGRHRKHYLWLLTQSYSAIPKKLRRQAKPIFVWYPKERADLKMIHDENNVLTDDELIIVRDF